MKFIEPTHVFSDLVMKGKYKELLNLMKRVAMCQLGYDCLFFLITFDHTIFFFDFSCIAKTLSTCDNNQSFLLTQSSCRHKLTKARKWAG